MPGDQTHPAPMYPVTHPPVAIGLKKFLPLMIRRRSYFVTTQNPTDPRNMTQNYLFGERGISVVGGKVCVCVMACPCGSVPVGVETLHERLSCSRPGKKVAGLSETLTCQIGTHQCTRRPMEEWDARHKDKVYWQAGENPPLLSAEQSGPKDGRRDADHRRFD